MAAIEVIKIIFTAWLRTLPQPLLFGKFVTMDKQLNDDAQKQGLADNIIEVIDESKDDKAEKYNAEVARLNIFRDELITLFHKSQDSFEKQLSFISGGALALSVGFIKDIVTPFKQSSYKGLLGWGWGFLVATLLLNCISHLLAARNANRNVKEINEDDYDPERVAKRNKKIVSLNWVTVGTMMVGIALIIAYIIYNTLL